MVAAEKTELFLDSFSILINSTFCNEQDFSCQNVCMNMDTS